MSGEPGVSGHEKAGRHGWEAAEAEVLSPERCHLGRKVVTHGRGGVGNWNAVILVVDEDSMDA